MTSRFHERAFRISRAPLGGTPRKEVMSVTDELNELIALHGNARDALNVTLAKLRQAESEIAVLKEAAEQSVQPTDGGLAQSDGESKSPTISG